MTRLDLIVLQVVGLTRLIILVRGTEDTVQGKYSQYNFRSSEWKYISKSELRHHDRKDSRERKRGLIRLRIPNWIVAYGRLNKTLVLARDINSNILAEVVNESMMQLNPRFRASE